MKLFRKSTPPVSEFEAGRAAAIRRAAALALQMVDAQGARLIAVAAPSGGEGASVVGTALAESLGERSGGRVVLIDGARAGLGPDAHAWLQAESTDLAGSVRQEAHARFARVQGFPADRFPDSRGAEAFTTALRGVCDVAVVVLPPLLTKPEALSLAARLDGVILVLEAERTRWEVAHAAKQLLDNIGVRVLGAVLNKRPRHIPDFIYRRL